jgi:hemolysin activation/secretion protein
LPGKFQLYGRLQGQVADQPLVSSEQFTATGADYVRGYLESEVLGDSAVVGTVELRTPNVGEEGPSGKDAAGKDAARPPGRINVVNDWRFFVFADGGHSILLDPLPAQQASFWVASVGAGTRIRLFDYTNGMVAVAVPMISQSFTAANNARVLFRFWGEF